MQSTGTVLVTEDYVLVLVLVLGPLVQVFVPYVFVLVLVC